MYLASNDILENKVNIPISLYEREASANHGTMLKELGNNYVTLTVALDTTTSLTQLKKNKYSQQKKSRMCMHMEMFLPL